MPSDSVPRARKIKVSNFQNPKSKIQISNFRIPNPNFTGHLIPRHPQSTPKAPLKYFTPKHSTPLTNSLRKPFKEPIKKSPEESPKSPPKSPSKSTPKSPPKPTPKTYPSKLANWRIWGGKFWKKFGLFGFVLLSALVRRNYAKVSGASISATAGGYVFPCTATLPNLTLGLGSYQAVVPGSYFNYLPYSGNCTFVSFLIFSFLFRLFFV